MPIMVLLPNFGMGASPVGATPTRYRTITLPTRVISCAAGSVYRIRYKLISGSATVQTINNASNFIIIDMQTQDP